MLVSILSRQYGYCYIIVFLFFSCGGLSRISKPQSGSILLSSVLEEEVCNVAINDIVYLTNRTIITDRSLGIDPKNWVELKSVKNPVRVSVTFEGNLVGETTDLRPITRRISLDTILDLRKGKYLMVQARETIIQFSYSRKKIRLE